MIGHEPSDKPEVGSRHRWLNRLQTVLLVLTLLGIAAMAGSLLLGEQGVWLALASAVLALLIEPAAASRLTLRLYGARPPAPERSPGFLVGGARIGNPSRFARCAGAA
jgi:heat shock protein HtpX